jgi:hypothetical protein
MATHDVPLAQILALNACDAWRQGMDVSGGNYEESHFDDELQKVIAERLALTGGGVKQWQAYPSRSAAILRSWTS